MHKHGGPRGSGNYSKPNTKGLLDISHIVTQRPKAEICKKCGRVFLTDGDSDCAQIKREREQGWHTWVCPRCSYLWDVKTPEEKTP